MPIAPMPPKFTAPAAKIWNAISPDDQQKLVSNAWCSKCRQEVTVADYSGSVKAGHVLLNGVCSQCGEVASRLIEVTRNEDKSLTIALGKPKLTWAEAFSESQLVKKESATLMKRLRQLRRKENDGTLTKVEQKELGKISPKGTNEMLSKMMAAAVRLSESIDR